MIRTNCPRDCYDGCGILVEAATSAAQPLRILGDPEHPVSKGRLCSKCAVAYNGVWQDADARLTQPLRRTVQDGQVSFTPVSWDDALAEVAQRLHEAIARGGPGSILHTHYSGTLSLLAYMFPNRFFQHLGASEVDPDTICNAAGHVAWDLLFGNSGMGFDPRTIADTSCVLVWGANPSHSAPHAHEHWLGETEAPVVVVDPIRTETARAATLHLQPKPGTDAALAFALLHELQSLGAFDQAFIADHVLGFEAVEADIGACSAQWGEAQTGVPAADIKQAARLYAAGPALLWCGQGLQRQKDGGNIMRAVGMLPALTGNVGKPGAGFYYLNYTPAFVGMDLAGLAGAGVPSRYPEATPGTSVSHMELAQRLAESDEFLVFMAWNTNPVASAADQNGLRRALARDDLFTVVVDCFMTDSAQCADIVLPAAGFLEFDDLTYSYFHLLLGAQAKVREPVGDALPNQEIFRRLAKAMGFTEPALYEPDDSLITGLLKQAGDRWQFESLRAQGAQYISPEALNLWATLEFSTPSGRIELYSEKALALGLPGAAFPDASDSSAEASAEGWLRLLTPASRWRLNDSYGNDPHLQSQSGPASVIMHPQDAARIGVQEGGRIRLENDTGALELQVEVADIAMPGVAVSYKGRWPAHEPSGANVNVLHSPQTADMGGSSAVHAARVRAIALH